MASNLFTTKKMKAEKKPWLKRSLIGSAIAAVVAGAGFGIYNASKDSKPVETQNQYAQPQQKPIEKFDSKPFERSAPPVASDLATKKQESLNSSGKKLSGKSASKTKKHLASGHHKKHKGHKVAHHKKHHGKKLAAHHKKHGKHHVAAHKKKHHKKIVHKKSNSKKELAAK